MIQEGAMPDETPPAATAGEEKPPEGDTNTVVERAEHPDAVKKALDEERKARREAEKVAKQHEARIKEFEDSQKTEQEKLNERLTGAEKRAAEAESRLLRHEVAQAKGLPANLVDFLTGTSREELEQKADQLVEAVKPAAASFDAGVRGATVETGGMDTLIRRAAGRA